VADRVFCIDFGSAYTKVALRRDPGADSELIACRTATVGVADFCVPSTAAVDRREAKPKPIFGDQAASTTAGSGIEVYHNWKKSVFLVPGARPHQSPLEALLESNELHELAAKYGVATGQMGYLRQLVGAAKSLVAGPGGRVVSAEVQQQTLAASLAPHFFQWLRQQVLEACSRLPEVGLRYETIPVRLTVPAFAHGSEVTANPGCKTLLDALSRVGWPLHPDRPVVAEPYSNAIGILTKASNVHRARVRLGEMFGKGPLVTVLKDATHHPVYRAVVIDVGAFTTDFAALALKPDDDNTSDPDAGFTISQHSVPAGVSDLDSRVVESLPKEKGEWLRKAKVIDLEDFRVAVYSEGKGFRRPDVGVIGGPGESEAVATALGGFAGRLVEEAEQFIASLPAVPNGSLQELILTGGGTAIPAVRDALIGAAGSNGQSYVKVHAPAIKKTPAGPLVHKLDERFTRGGSALGGASLYFEKPSAA
jgi:hypothetical protein